MPWATMEIRKSILVNSNIKGKMIRKKYTKKKHEVRDEKDLNWMEVLVQRSSDPKWNKPDRKRPYRRKDSDDKS